MLKGLGDTWDSGIRGSGCLAVSKGFTVFWDFLFMGLAIIEFFLL